MIQVSVFCEPGSQGSKKHVGNGVMIEMSTKLKPWREAVVWAAREAMNGFVGHGLQGPVDVEIIFTLAKPKSAPKRRVTWPDRYPDVDKLCRSTFDALKSAGAIEDDARVVRLVAEKCFPGTHPLSLPVPGATIRIWSVSERKNVEMK